MSLVRALAAVWAVSEEQVQQHLVLTKPALQTSHSHVSIGRAVLPLAAESTNSGMLSPANANQVRPCLSCCLHGCIDCLLLVAAMGVPCCQKRKETATLQAITMGALSKVAPQGSPCCQLCAGFAVVSGCLFVQ